MIKFPTLVSNGGRVSLLAACMAAVLFAVPAAYAGGHGSEQAGHHQHAGKHGARMFEKMAKRLELTEEQRVQAKAIHESGKAERQADRQAERSMHEQYRELTNAGASEAELKALADQMAQKRSQKMVTHSLQMQKFRALLSAEQQLKLDKMHEGRKARHGERRVADEEVDD